MKPRLSLLLATLGAALFSLPVLQAEENSAGGPGGPGGGHGGGPPDGQREMRREGMGDRMAEELGLTADQKARMKELNQQEKAELDALRGDTATAKEDKRARFEAIRKSYMDKRQAIMTPEQREKARQMRENMRDKMEKRRDEHHKERPGAPADQK